MSKAVFIIFPKLETRFNTHYQNMYANAFWNVFLELLHLSLNTIVSTSREEGLVTLRSCIAQFDPQSRDHVGHKPLRRSVRDIKAFQNNFAFIIAT